MNPQRTIKLTLAYDGTAYSGWQRQLRQPTIQQTVEEALTTMTGSPVTLHGAGRTDAGVHALAMTASFTSNSKIPCPGFTKGLNSILPSDIRILQTMDMAADFHARFSATGKTYAYILATEPILLPTERLYAAHFPGTLDIEAMAGATTLLQGCRDFSCFEATGSRDPLAGSGRGAVRTISEARIDRHQGPVGLKIEITGDGFLRHMVRNIVGTLLHIGQGKLTLGAMEALMANKDRSAAPPTAPARGLFLIKVHY